MLETRALSFSPDLVVAQLSLNDPYPSNTPYALLAPEGPSRLWDFVFRRLAPDHFWAMFLVGHLYDEPGIANVRRGIARLAHIAHRGPPMLAVLFPYLYAPAYDAWGFERFHEVYRQAAREAGLPLLDLLEPFRRAGAIGSQSGDPIHPGREGHEIAAAEIRNALDRLGLLPGAGGDGSRSGVVPGLDR
jgi:lysophospholipase L1-like esterase